MDGTIGEIRMFAGTFAPRAWALCNGQIMAISQNTALFSILGTTYGGNGQTTYALPDLRSRVPLHPGQGPGLTNRNLGEMSGTETVSLTVAQMPAHNHALQASNTVANSSDPTLHTVASVVDATANAMPSFTTASPTVNLNAQSISGTGANVPHDNMPPFTGVNFIICLQGLFPSRN